MITHFELNFVVVRQMRNDRNTLFFKMKSQTHNIGIPFPWNASSLLGVWSLKNRRINHIHEVASLLENFRTKTTLPTKQGQFEVWFKLLRKYSFKKKWYLKKLKIPDLVFFGGGEMDKVRLHKEGLYTIGGKRGWKNKIPPCLYYQTKTPSIIFG